MFPWREVVGTLLLLAMAGGIRMLAQRTVRRQGEFLTEHRRRLLANIRNALFFVVVIGLVLIWAPSLRTAALSLTAFTVAIILATKELILCLSGAFVRAASTSFRVGNWIDVQSVRGEVIDITLLTFTVQELYADGRLHEFTGRTVTFPNSVLLTTPVRNENFYNRFVFHRFVLHLDMDLDPAPVERVICDSLIAAMEPHQEVARRYNALIEHKAGLDIMGTEPRVRLETGSEGRVRLETVMFMPTHQASDFEQTAIRAALTEIRAQKAAVAKPD